MADKSILVENTFRQGKHIQDELFSRNQMRVIHNTVISKDLRLTSEEKLKLKCLYSLNMDNFGIVFLKEMQKEPFSKDYLQSAGLNGMVGRVRRAVALTYDDGISCDFCTTPHAYCDEYFVITDGYSSPNIAGIIDYDSKNGVYSVTLLKTPFNNNTVVYLNRANGLLSMENLYPTVSLKGESELEDYLLAYNPFKHREAANQKTFDYDYTHKQSTPEPEKG